jgi:mRNA interferase MazF
MTLPYADVQRIIKWTSEKYRLLRNVVPAAGRRVKRGQIYWCEFGENIGSEQNLRRPALILQNDPANITSPNTIVAPITNQLATGRVIVPITRAAGSPVTGYILLGNIVTISKARLGDKIDNLGKDINGEDEMEKVEEALFHSVGVFDQINKTKKYLERTLTHLDTVKKERNEAVDAIADIKKELGLTNADDAKVILDEIQKLKSIDETK